MCSPSSIGSLFKKTLKVSLANRDRLSLSGVAKGEACADQTREPRDCGRGLAPSDVEPAPQSPRSRSETQSAGPWWVPRRALDGARQRTRRTQCSLWPTG